MLTGKRIGIIGLDTSHSINYTKLINSTGGEEFLGYKVVAAYPYGSIDIAGAAEWIDKYTKEICLYGVQIVDSIEALLALVDSVLLLTNDGRMHFEQATPIMKAGKRLYINKPIAASITGAIAINEISNKYNTPFFTSSSLRFTESVQEIVAGRVGKVLGAYTFSPAHIEKTHPDFFWYGIHAVEMLFAVLGKGCKSVIRISEKDDDVITGRWCDGRIGIVKGWRAGVLDYGGIVFGKKGNATLTYNGYNPLIKKIITFFEDGIPPVDFDETLEMLAFMEAADESKNNGGRIHMLKS